MGCMCAECRFAKGTGDPNLVLCDNWGQIIMDPRWMIGATVAIMEK